MSYTEVYKTLPFDFLSDIVYQFVRFAKQLVPGTRVVIGRFGMILSNEGGALQNNETTIQILHWW